MLLTGSMATPALAAYPPVENGTPEASDWDFPSVFGDPANLIQDNTISIPAGLGSENAALTYKLSLPAGKYLVEFEEATNVQVGIKLPGASEPTALSEEDGKFSFEVTGSSKVEVTICIWAQDDKDGGAYSFTSAKIVLDFDKDAAVAELQTALDNLEALQTVDTDREEIKDELDAKKTELEGQIADVKDQIAALDAATENFATYEKYGFNKPTNDIQAAIDELTTEVEDYNAAVEAENEAYQNKLVNEPKYEALIAEADKLVEDIATLLGEIEDNTEYVQNECLADAKALSEEINAYKSLIETTYADLYEKIEFESQAPLLQGKLDALQQTYDEVNTDSQAYEQFMADYSKLTEYKDKCLADIADFEGITPYETVYDELAATYEEQINKAYNDGIKTLTIKVGEEEGAAAKLEANQTIIASIKAQIEASFNEIDGIVTDQNDKYKADRDNYRALQGKLTEEVTNPADPAIQALPESLRYAYTDVYGKAQTALEELRNQLIADYKAHTLNSDEYNAAVANAEQAIETAKDWKDARLNPILNVQNALDDFKKHIADYSEEKDLPAQYDVYTKFEESVESIQNTIDNMIAGASLPEDDENYLSDEQLKTSSDGLLNTINEILTPAADDMIDALATAYNSIQDISEAIATLEAQVAAKQSVAGADLNKTTYTTNTVEPFKEQLVALNTAFEDAWELPGQQCYEAAVALGKSIEEDNLLQQVEDAQLDFAKTRTQSNQTAVNKRFTDAQAAAAKLATEAGYSTINFTKANEAKTEADDAVTAATDVADYTEADTLLQDAIDALVPVETQIKLVSDNAKAYHEVLEPLETKVQGVLDDLDAYFFGKATEQAAYDYYSQEELGALIKRLEEAKAQDKKEYNALTAAKNQATLETVLNTIITDANNLKEAFDANEAAHNNQNNVLQGVADLINQAIENVDNNNVDFISDDELAQEYKDKAHDLLEQLMGVDQQISDAYRNGESFEKNQELLDAIDAIKTSFNELMEEYGDEYHKAVVEENNKTVTDSDWDESIADAKDAYLQGVQAYNVYRFNITNETYLNFPQVATTLDKYATLFQNTTELNKLISEMQLDLLDKNSQNVLMTAEEMDAWVKKVNDLAESINDAISQMNLDMVQAADAFYAEREAEVKANLDQAERELVAAGITDPELLLAIHKKAQDDYTDAVLRYQPYGNNVQVKGPEFAGTVMNGIADLFDASLAALTPEDLQKAGEAYWADEYAKVVEALDKLDKTITDSTAADLSVRQNAANVLTQEGQKLDNLNNTATADESILSHLQGYTDQLKDILKNVNDATAAVEASQSANTNLAALKDKYNNVEIPLFNSRLKDLKAYVATLGGGQEPTAQQGIESVVTAIKNLQNAVDVANVSTGETNVASADKAVRDAFISAYKAAKQAEKNYLNQLCDDLVVYFQNAVDYADGEIDITAKDAFNKQIVELRIRILGLLVDTDNTTFANSALTLEQDICDLIVEVEKWYPEDVPTTLDTVNAELQEAYDAAEKALNEEKEKFDAYEDVVKEKYGEQLEAIETALNNAKESWDNMGNLAIAQAPNLEATFAEVEKNIETLSPEAEAFNNKVVLNNQVYATLNSGIENLEEKIADQLAVAEKYNTGDTDYINNSFTVPVGNLKDAIEAENEAYALDSTNEANYQATIDQYKANINSNMAWNLNKAYNTVEKPALETAVADLANVLFTNFKNQGIVPEVYDELVQKYNDAWRALNIDIPNQQSKLAEFFSNGAYTAATDSYALPEEVNGARTTVWVSKTYTQLVEEYKAMLDSMAALVEDLKTDIETAKENTYLLGDVVNPLEKVVNVADVQQLIDWVGYGVTLQDIADDASLGGMLVACAANIAGTNPGTINGQHLNIADVTATVNAALTENWSTAQRMAMRMAKLNGGNSSIELKYMGESNGVRSYAVVLTNAIAFAGGQFDLNLSEGLELVETSTAMATENHNLFAYDNAQGARLIIASFENDEISVNAGTIAVIEVKGNGKIGLENAIFADAIGQEYELQSGNATMIDQIIDGANTVKEAVYDAAGRVLNKVQRGINIIRNSDGTVTKEMRRK